jgi:hypothetical protein
MTTDDHRAYYVVLTDGTINGGCTTCGTSFSGASKIEAVSWCSGHNSAVGCARYEARIELEAVLVELWQHWERAHLDECRAIDKETGLCPSEEDGECRWPMPAWLRKADD